MAFRSRVGFPPSLLGVPSSPVWPLCPLSGRPGIPTRGRVFADRTSVEECSCTHRIVASLPESPNVSPVRKRAALQEIGRAGRDGRTAHCCLLLCDRDFVTHHSLAHSKGLELVQVRGPSCGERSSLSSSLSLGNEECAAVKVGEIGLSHSGVTAAPQMSEESFRAALFLVAENCGKKSPVLYRRRVFLRSLRLMKASVGSNGDASSGG